MKSKIILVLITVLVLFPFSGKSQFDVLGKAKRAVNNKVNNKVDDEINKGVEAAGNKVIDLLSKKKKTDKPVEVTTEVPSENSVEKPEAKPEAKKEESLTLQSYSKFDFIPGEKVIFYDDFSESSVGDFPPNWNTNASGEVVTTNLYPGKWFKMQGSGCVAIEEGIKLPDNYTIEYDVIAFPSSPENSAFEFGFYLYSAENPKSLDEGGAVPGLKGGIKMSFGYRGTYNAYDESGYTINGYKETAVLAPGKKHKLSFWVQKTRLRVYLDDAKIFDLPKVFKQGFQTNQMRFELWESGNPMITNFRVAAGLPDLRSKLITEGKLVSYGIYFDVNKDIVKPESYATLKGIAEVLKENPAVRVKIVGFTDSDGADAANLDLSKRRGAAVKNELVKTFGIDASRLESDGLGETKPVAPNDTPVNKALNRRVEFNKL